MMASPAGPIANAVEERSTESPNPSAIQNPRGGPKDRNRNRRRGGSTAAHEDGQNLEASTSQQSRRRHARPRGRGDFGMHQISLQDRDQNHTATASAQPDPLLDLPPVPGGGGTYGGRLTIDAKTTEGEVLVQDQAEGGGDEETELCFICASPIVHSSVAPCNHRTCHICALRLRALYKTRACAHCRVGAIPSLM